MLQPQKTYLLWLWVGILLFQPRMCFCQTFEEQTVLAALSLNLVRFTTWPDSMLAQMQNGIVFCVIGDNVVQESFASINNKPVGNTLLKVVNLPRPANFEQCHALYISQLKENILRQVFVEIKNRPLLSIGEGADFAHLGGMVGLENIDGKINLKINLSVVRTADLKISARLLSLATIIDN